MVLSNTQKSVTMAIRTTIDTARVWRIAGDLFVVMALYTSATETVIVTKTVPPIIVSKRNVTMVIPTTVMAAHQSVDTNTSIVSQVNKDYCTSLSHDTCVLSHITQKGVKSSEKGRKVKKEGSKRGVKKDFTPILLRPLDFTPFYFTPFSNETEFRYMKRKIRYNDDPTCVTKIPFPVTNFPFHVTKFRFV